MILGTFNVDSQLGVTQQLCSERVLGTREEGFLVWCFAGQRGFFPSCTSFRDGLEEGHRCFFNAPSPKHRLVSNEGHSLCCDLHLTLRQPSPGTTVPLCMQDFLFYVGHFRLGIQTAIWRAGGRSSGSW